MQSTQVIYDGSMYTKKKKKKRHNRTIYTYHPYNILHHCILHHCNNFISTNVKLLAHQSPPIHSNPIYYSISSCFYYPSVTTFNQLLPALCCLTPSVSSPISLLSYILPYLYWPTASPAKPNHCPMPPQYRLQIGAININSNRTASYDSKVQHFDFTYLTQGLDVIGLTETHAATEQEVQKHGYCQFSIIRKKATLARSNSGGITVLVSNHLAPSTTMCDWSSPCCLAIKISGSPIGQPSDLYILTVYLPPEHSSYLKSTKTDPFAVLNQACSHIPPNAHTLLMGDFNAHTATATGATPYVRHDLLPSHHDDVTPPHSPPPRASRDTRPIDKYGKHLLQLCANRNYTILNGCTPGDSQGQYTYERGNIGSIIDYGITSPSLWPFVCTFRVGLHNSVLSDHSIILTDLNLYTTPHHAPPPRTTPSPLLKFDWSPEATTRLSAKLREPHTQLQIELLERRLQLPSPDVDGIVSSFTELFLDAAKQVVRFRKKGPPSKKQKSGRKWYDQSLRSLKKRNLHPQPSSSILTIPPLGWTDQSKNKSVPPPPPL